MEDVLTDLLGSSGTSDEFWQRVKINLQAKKIRLLFVADLIPLELRRIVEFLNEQMGTVEVLAIELRQFASKGLKTLVPTVYGQTQEASSKRNAATTTLTEDEFFAGLDALRPGTATALRAFLAAQEDLHVKYEVRKTLIVRLIVGDLRVLPFVINRDGVVDTGYTPQKEVMRPFTERLAAGIPGAYAKETPKTWYIPRRKSDGNQITVWDILDNQAACRASLEILFQTMIAYTNEGRQ